MAPTYDDLYERAQELEIEGRSDMDKDELEAAVAAEEGTLDPTADASAGAPAQGNLVQDDRPRAQQTDPNVPNAGDSGRVIRAEQPDYSADDDGYVGVDPEYRNASDHKRQPLPSADEGESE